VLFLPMYHQPCTKCPVNSIRPESMTASDQLCHFIFTRECVAMDADLVTARVKIKGLNRFSTLNNNDKI
jgi:hypothetical protein